ncbi:MULTISPECIES: DUF7471 family protein [Halorubrum]|uniref:Uncharacterized protein n=1 Tax=Halorubrum hochstenium ATCC 700873 TaxID=1227481 RepID=M0F1V9_9EURY|nr:MULTISPECIES: hypothetical protein [Halorubrum]ELZ54031.1 hypothetical protein C467_12287 [Halorubrum hochstenium ATCC 700873]
MTQSLTGSLPALAGWSVEGSIPILAIVIVAGLGTATLFAVSLAAYRRRRRAQYRLISLAVGALLARSVVGAGTVLGVVPMPAHHLIAHGLDFLIAALVLYAVYAHAPGAIGDDTVSD